MKDDVTIGIPFHACGRPRFNKNSLCSKIAPCKMGPSFQSLFNFSVMVAAETTMRGLLGAQAALAQSASVKLFGVFRTTCAQSQVFWSIVSGVAIEMMHHFNGRKVAPKHFFHDQSVFQHIASFTGAWMLRASFHVVALVKHPIFSRFRFASGGNIKTLAASLKRPIGVRSSKLLAAVNAMLNRVNSWPSTFHIYGATS